MIPIYKDSELTGEVRETLMRRSQAEIAGLMPQVHHWLEEVKTRGDDAVVEYIQKFDNKSFTQQDLAVSKDDIAAAYKAVDPEVLAVIKQQIEISSNFHTEQAKRVFAEGTWEIEYVPGVITGSRKTVIGSAGLYVPAGKAPLPSTAQMLTVAAKAAGVPRIVVCFPPTAYYPEILVSADLAGADEIYRVGGIAAVAALAYGTETISQVDVVAGPGSSWVQAAKLSVFGEVGIDMLAGPSEGLIIADENAKADWLAADIIAMCEHGSDSCMVMLTTSSALAEAVENELETQVKQRNFEETIRAAFVNGYNAIVLLDTVEDMVNFANEYAPEHLEIQTADADSVAAKIHNAGSIFIGEYTPGPVGDYASGTNHSLPTGRAVKFSSPVGVETFVKSLQYQRLNQAGLAALEPIVTTVSDIEGLDGHGEAVRLRCGNARGASAITADKKAKSG